MTAIIIVNWNCWEDTARCIEACLKLDDFTGSIFVCDNGSTDSSVDQLQTWAQGKLKIKSDSLSAEIVNLIQPTELRPLNIITGSEAFIKEAILKNGAAIQRCIYLIKAGANLGFAGGNNAAIRTALLDPTIDIFWLLNPDTLPDKKSFRELKKHCHKKNYPLISGSLLIEYWKPDTIQACGANFSKLTLTTTHRLENVLVKDIKNIPECIDVDYPVGASLILNKKFIMENGLLDERYFLYFEEIDLCLRLKNKKPFIVTKSIVYHKGGASTGGGRTLSKKSIVSDYYYLRGRLLLSRKISKFAMTLSLTAAPLQIIKRLFTSKKHFFNSVLAILDGINNVTGKKRH